MASLFRRPWAPATADSRPPRPARARLSVEPLEDRAVPATFTVTTLSDTLNTGGQLSLRSAIALANQDTTTDVINFDQNLFTPGQMKTLTLNLPLAQGGGQLNIIKPMNIVGPGASQLTIKQTLTNQRIFNINNGNNTVITVSISGMTITGGSTSPTYTPNGGAIYNYNENVTLSGVEIDGNTASGSGGAVASLTKDNGSGLIIQNSTFAGNTATAGGGGALSIDGNQNIIITNTTIVQNAASKGNGGGIQFLGGNVTLLNDTITNNTSKSASGGGISIGASVQATLQNTIVAKNGPTDDINGNVTAASNFNLIGSGVGNNFVDGQSNNIVGADPVLGGLSRDIISQVKTEDPLIGSPAIDSGTTNSLTTDARGVKRPQGAAYDIGAVEVLSSGVGGSGGGGIVGSGGGGGGGGVQVGSGSGGGTGTGTTGVPGTGSGAGSGTPQPAPSPAPPALAAILTFLAAQGPGSRIQIAGFVDFNGDGTLDVVLVSTRNRVSQLIVLDGVNGMPLFMLPLSTRR